jgi:rhamnosyltransferase
MRSFNEAWALKGTLEALKIQDWKNWELIVIDSGSSDGSDALIRAANPAHFIQIQPQDYNPSRVMNHGMRLARSEWVVFLNADATPQNAGWLRPLVSALQNPRVAAVFGRQIPRPDCEAVFACDYERAFGPERESVRWDHFFSMVSSGIRRDIWAKRGFREDLQYAEDDEYTRWCRAEGHSVLYRPESVVMHSHNYTPAQAYKRSFGDARALAAIWPGQKGDFNWLKTVALGSLRDFKNDLRYAFKNGTWLELPHSAQIRLQQRLGRLAGFHAGWSQYRDTHS